MQLHNVHDVILEQAEVKKALDVVRAKEKDRRELPGRYAAEYAAWAKRVRELDPSEGVPLEPPAQVPVNVDDSARTRVRLAEQDLEGVVTPLRDDLMTLLKEREVVLLDEVRGYVERLNEIGDEIGSLIVSAQWIDTLAGAGSFVVAQNHPLYNRPPEVIIELAGHDGGSFFGIDDPDVWNLSKVGRHSNVGGRRTS